MTLFELVNLVFTNNGITLGIGLTILFILISIIMSIQDYRIGLISLLLFSGVNYILQALIGLDLILPTYLLFISIILMAFSIFVVRHGGQVTG